MSTLLDCQLRTECTYLLLRWTLAKHDLHLDWFTLAGLITCAVAGANL